MMYAWLPLAVMQATVPLRWIVGLLAAMNQTLPDDAPPFVPVASIDMRFGPEMTSRACTLDALAIAGRAASANTAAANAADLRPMREHLRAVILTEW